MHACVHVHACMRAFVCVCVSVCACTYWLKLHWGSLVICLLHALPGYSFSWHTRICIQTETKDHVCPFCWWQLRRNCMYNSKNIRWVSFWPNADWKMAKCTTHNWFVLLVHIFVFVVVVTRRLELHRESFTVSCRPWCTYPEASFSVPTITDTCGCTNRLLFLDNGIRHYSALDKLNTYNRNVFFYNSARASRETTMVDLRHRA